MVIVVEFFVFFLGKKNRRTRYIGHHLVNVGQWQQVVFE